MFKFIGLTGLMVAMVGILAIGSSAGASAQTTNAKLRVLHASPDAPVVDVFVDGSEAVSGLAFDSITDYLSVPAGAHGIQVFPASANGTGTPVIDVPSITLDGGKDYTVAAVGTLASIEPLVLVDNNSAPATGKAHLRVVHASPDAPNVDIAAAGAGVVISDLPFKEASAYLPLDATSYDLEVRAAGATDAVLDLPGVTLEAGKVYTAFAVGFAGGQPALSVKLVTDAVTQQPTSGALPSSGGPPSSSDSTTILWVVVGISLIVAGVSAGSLAIARAKSRE